MYIFAGKSAMSIKKNISKKCDILILTSIFLILLLYIIQYTGIKFKAFDQRRMFDLFAMLEILILSTGQVWKAYRLDACIYTKIAVWTYVSFLIVSIGYIIFPFDYKIMLNVVLIFIIIGLSSMLFTFIYYLLK